MTRGRDDKRARDRSTDVRRAPGAACRVSRSAVVRVAIAEWLDVAIAAPAVVTEAICVALVRRGRKAKR